jgi:hypothetical protein
MMNIIMKLNREMQKGEGSHIDSLKVRGILFYVG